MTRQRIIPAAALLLSLLSLGILWGTEIPLGVPGEWVWGRIPIEPAERLDVLISGLISLIVALGYGFFTWAGVRRVEVASPVETGLWCAGLVAAGFGWLCVVQSSPPTGFGFSKSAWVLYYPASSGYFTEAQSRPESLREYLAQYEADVRSPDTSRRVLHHGTHPPGLFLFYRGLIRWCESSPGLVKFLSRTRPTSVELMFDEIAARPSPNLPPLREVDRAVIWLAALLIQLGGAMVVVPLFFLACQHTTRSAAWMTAACWPLVPALATFLPKSDVLCAFLGVCFLATWCSGWRRQSWLRCGLAGGIFWIGLMISLALLPIALIAGLWSLWHLFFSDRPRTGSRLWSGYGRPVLAGVLGVVLPCLIIWAGTGLNLLAVWRQNYLNHAEFYQHFQRGYGTWLLMNPLETLYALGAPAFVLGMAAYVLLGTHRKAWPWVKWGPYVAFAVVMGTLWISGKNRGEAARLWLVIFPCFLWVSAPTWETSSPGEPNQCGPSQSFVLSMLALQMIACWLTVVRVNGFPL